MMERFTGRNESGDLTLCGEQIYGNNQNTFYNALLELEQYENTGLEPDEVPHWIPVSERLPEPETNVLILQSYEEDAPYSNITIGHLHQENDLRRKPYWAWIAYGADMVNPKIEAYHRAEFICAGSEFVTHWQPLPQSPKGELE
jgi:hypothetical protein